MAFPGVSADRETADYAVVGAPLDVSTTFRPGTRFGPARVRELAATFEDYDHHTDSHFTDCAVSDHGDVGAAGAVDDAAEYLTFLEGELDDLRADGIVPVLIGGEHTVSVAGVRSVEPDVFVCLDAHLDLREGYAGNPLSHSTVTRHALEVADRAVILGHEPAAKRVGARRRRGRDGRPARGSERMDTRFRGRIGLSQRRRRRRRPRIRARHRDDGAVRPDATGDPRRGSVGRTPR